MNGPTASLRRTARSRNCDGADADALKKFRNHAATKRFLAEWPSNQFGAVSLCQLDPTREPGVWRLSEAERARFERIGPAKAFDRTGIARVDPLRLVAREQDELWFQAQIANSIEEMLRYSVGF